MSQKVPEGWRAASLKDVCRHVSRGDAPKYATEKTGIWAVGQKSIRNNEVDISQCRPHDTNKPHKEASVLRPGDICVNSTGTGTLGRVGLWRDFSNDTFFADTHVTIVRPDVSRVVPKFLVEWLSKPSTQKAVYNGCVTGSTNQIELNKSAFQALVLSLPSLPEQRRVAEILSSVDEAIQASQAVIEQTRKVKQGVLKRLLTRGIGHVRFKRTEIGEVPEAWEVVTLGTLLKTGDITGIQDGNHGELHPKASDYTADGIPFIMARDLIGGTIGVHGSAKITKKQADSLRIGRSLPGDVLLTHKGTVGRVAITPECPFYVMLTPQVTYYRISDSGRLQRDFLATVFKGEQFQSALQINSDQTTRKYIGITEQKKLFIPLPSAQEQAKISHHMKEAEDAESIASECLGQMQSVKITLMSDLLTGRKRVSIDDLIAAAE